jgi:hypothetical protein
MKIKIVHILAWESPWPAQAHKPRTGALQLRGEFSAARDVAMGNRKPPPPMVMQWVVWLSSIIRTKHKGSYTATEPWNSNRTQNNFQDMGVWYVRQVK